MTKHIKVENDVAFCLKCGGILDVEKCDFNGRIANPFYVVVCNNPKCKDYRIAQGSDRKDIRKYIKKYLRSLEIEYARSL